MLVLITISNNVSHVDFAVIVLKGTASGHLECWSTKHSTYLCLRTDGGSIGPIISTFTVSNGNSGLAGTILIAEDVVNDPFPRQGCKKMNLNHLLNFTLAPLENRDANQRRITSNRTKLPKYNKELFLQSNCQFVVKDSGNYTVHQKNPDILVEWSLIEEIRLPSHEVPLCPICLYSPIAAKITRCGHIYCWPCILHYLSLTDRTWQKCPICFEAVHKTELKSVTLRIRKPFAVGDEITMCLMKREKGSLCAVPVFHQSSVLSTCYVHDDDFVTRFQKLLLANKSEIYEIISREHLELETLYHEEKNTPEACFIESALQLLDERQGQLNDDYGVNDVGSVMKTDLPEENAIVAANASPQSRLTSLSSTDFQEEIFYMELNDNTSQIDNSSNSSVNETPHEETGRKGSNYFYQAEDGQHIYLHNINVRMLLKEHGSLEYAPPMVKAKIVEIERVSMTEVLRKRLRYLQHLPLTCEFQIVELNFSQILSKPTINLFKGEVNKRRILRNRKARDERRREKYIQVEENKKLGKYPKATYNLESIDQFPTYQSEFQYLSPPRTENDVGAQDSNLCCNINDPSVPDTETSPVTSFAQMLKDGRKTFTEIPKEVKKQNTVVSPQSSQNRDSDGDEWIPPPEYHQSFSDAIQAALDSVTIQDPQGKSSGFVTALRDLSQRKGEDYHPSS
ncbi:RING finger protein 10-like [Stegodyphus dumicola]|uniref:RING finger protein 10-like n=1 Tax=Stegodyphus dumicola TaxID=202533 RepID=UPI0015A82CD5|nr:RING finger protein 10-like [Stegodyphus dumicola]